MKYSRVSSSDRNEIKHGKESEFMNDIVEFLKSYIWENGFEKLTENPFDVYTDMIKRGKGKPCVDSRTARLVLVTMMSKTHEMARNGCSADDIIKHFQSEHFLNKKTAKEMASLYLELFSEDNKQAWNDAKEIGFAEFCKKEWTIEWGGCCEWYAKHNASYLCNAKACLTFEVQDKRRLRRHLS